MTLGRSSNPISSGERAEKQLETKILFFYPDDRKRDDHDLSHAQFVLALPNTEEYHHNSVAH